MIVVDTNLVAYFFVNGEHSGTAEKVFLKDSRWVAPLLWRSEFCSVLVKCLRKGFFEMDDAIRIMENLALRILPPGMARPISSKPNRAASTASLSLTARLSP